MNIFLKLFDFIVFKIEGEFFVFVRELREDRAGLAYLCSTYFLKEVFVP